MANEELLPYMPKAVEAYQNEHVLEALKNIDWFTADYIDKVRNDEPQPEREENLGPFKDKFLGDFFKFGYRSDDLGKGNETFMGVRNFLAQEMVGPQGHPYSIGEVSFADEQFLALAKELGVDKRYEVSRDMIWEVDPMIKCLIAPEGIRRKVVKVICSWGEGYKERRRDVILWAELVKRGAKQYLERQTVPSNQGK